MNVFLLRQNSKLLIFFRFGRENCSDLFMKQTRHQITGRID